MFLGLGLVDMRADQPAIEYRHRDDAVVRSAAVMFNGLGRIDSEKSSRQRELERGQAFGLGYFDLRSCRQDCAMRRLDHRALRDIAHGLRHDAGYRRDIELALIGLADYCTQRRRRALSVAARHVECEFRSVVHGASFEHVARDRTAAILERFYRFDVAFETLQTP